MGLLKKEATMDCYGCFIRLFVKYFAFCFITDGATVPSSAITILKIHRVQLYYFSLIMVPVGFLIRMNMS